MKKPRLVGQFIGPGEVVWKIYHAPARLFPRIFKYEGRWRLGMCYFAGPRKNRIYIDNAQSDAEIWDSTVHEIMHVCLRDVGLIEIIEEPIVDELATRIAYILGQLGS